MQLSDHQKKLFREAVWQHYHQNARAMPWRDNPSPYFVLVSELMLQQTQVSRVLPKFQEFVQLFPDFKTLAAASLADVLRAWSGLGYNRRAKFLHEAAQKVVDDFDGRLPSSVEDLVKLPGIGKNTAGAILNYAFQKPTVFIETNIRTVYFYHFFANETEVSDATLSQIVIETIDHENPREWFWALMDYGTFLKKQAGNNISKSKHYTKQSTFVGSRRQIRGQIVKLLLEGPQKLETIQQLLPDTCTSSVVEDLAKEGLIFRQNAQLRLTDTPKLP